MTGLFGHGRKTTIMVSSSRITYTAVAESCASLMAEGIQPSVRLLRDRLGGGSPNAILEHLRAWREQALQNPAEMPSSVRRAGDVVYEAALAQARSEWGERLVAADEQRLLAEREAADLLAEAEATRQAVARQEMALALAERAHQTLATQGAGALSRIEETLLRQEAALDHQERSADGRMSDLSQAVRSLGELIHGMGQRLDQVVRRYGDAAAATQERLDRLEAGLTGLIVESRRRADAQDHHRQELAEAVHVQRQQLADLQHQLTREAEQRGHRERIQHLSTLRWKREWAVQRGRIRR